MDHGAACIAKSERPIDEAIQQATAKIHAVAEALQALRGAALTTAATTVSGVGSSAPRRSGLRDHATAGPGGNAFSDWDAP